MTKWMRRMIEDGTLGHPTFQAASGEISEGQKRSDQEVEGKLGKTNI